MKLMIALIAFSIASSSFAEGPYLCQIKGVNGGQAGLADMGGGHLAIYIRGDGLYNITAKHGHVYLCNSPSHHVVLDLENNVLEKDGRRSTLVKCREAGE